jgi:DNA-directed RNA polymerase specialized sigma subunit
MEEIKKLLKNKNNLTASLDAISQQIEEIEAELEGIRNISYEGMPGGKGDRINTRKESLIIEKDNLKSKLRRTSEAVLFLNRALDLLKDEEREVIEAIFMDDMKINDICEKLSISRSQLHRLKFQALQSIAVIYFGIDAI